MSSENYRNLQVGLTVSDVRKSIEFYQGLGFTMGEKYENEGKLVYAELKAGNAQIGVGQDDFKKGKDRVKGVGVRLWLGTDADLRTVADNAKAAGLKLDSDVAETPWGTLAFSLSDPDGYAITVTNG